MKSRIGLKGKFGYGEALGDGMQEKGPHFGMARGLKSRESFDTQRGNGNQPAGSINPDALPISGRHNG
jgi:hypothetical protein